MLLGCIADDFTGATDLANNLVRGGMRVVQTIGVPLDVSTIDADAVGVALKFRTIAPVAEALQNALGADLVPVCPAFPEAQRTVYKGHLFVGDLLLSWRRDLGRMHASLGGAAIAYRTADRTGCTLVPCRNSGSRAARAAHRVEVRQLWRGRLLHKSLRKAAMREVWLRAKLLNRPGPNVWSADPAGTMATLEEVDETAKLRLVYAGRCTQLNTVQIEELRRAFGASW